MKKKVNSSDCDANDCELPKQKERHIVSWTQEEDDILREQIRLHGTENWAIIASNFKDKTTRQCRRRWFTYLNSDFKKGGWSPEEDVLLCEAQKVYGNRWTEIAKVVSGRTDNAVKNRFTTLCKKRAKREALAKENGTTSYINLNNKRVVFRNGCNMNGGSENVAPHKKIRAHMSSIVENCNQGENFGGECGVADGALRHPFALIPRSIQSCEFNFPNQIDIKAASTDGSIDDNIQRTYIEKDDPKLLALVQQAELLSSLAVKDSTENTDQSLENAWMVLQHFLGHNKEDPLVTVRNLDADSQVEKLKKLVEDLRSCDKGHKSSWREPDVYESSPASSENSAGSTLLSCLPHAKTEECETGIFVLHQKTEHVLQAEQLANQHCLAEKNEMCHTASTNEVKGALTCDGTKPDNGDACEYPDTEFSSPIHVTPFFRALAAAIPSPKFSESEKHFLMKTLGIDTTSTGPAANSSQPPPCKRSLLHCL